MDRKKKGLSSDTKCALLLKVTDEIRDTLDLDLILNYLLDTIHTIIPFDAAGIFVLNRAIGDLIPNRSRTIIAGVAQRGFDPGPPEYDTMLTTGAGIIGHVIRTAESVLVSDIRLDTRYVEGRKSTLSEIAVPIIKQQRAMGALNLESDRAGAFSTLDLETLRFFAIVAGMAIDKVLLHRQLIEKQRIEEQILMARDVQTQLLPHEAPVIDGYEIDGICIPCHQLGGDYFDYIPIQDRAWGFVVADVSGKGISAALIMSAFRALLRANMQQNPDPSFIGDVLNRQLPESSRKSDFVTASYGVLTPETGEFLYSNFGNTPPVLIRADGSTEELITGGPVLGVFQSAGYSKAAVLLNPGDMVMLYTDGVIECLDREENQYGFERLLDITRQTRHLAPWEIIHAIIRSTREFTGNEAYTDDFTVMILRRVP